ncbi:MAG: Flp pilus assembly protein CpaB [Hyphomicrobiaceae bacterium]
MKFKQLIALAYAVSAGALALGLSATYMRNLHQEASAFYGAQVRAVKTKPVAMSTVVTLAKSLPYGHKLRRGDFKETPWPVKSIPPGAFRNINALFSAHDTPIARFELSEGEVMLPAKINRSDRQSALSLLLPEGMRAVTIKVNEVRGVGGFIQPKDRVDIIMTEKSSVTDKGAPRRNSVLLQDILVMAIGQNVSAQNYKPTVANSVTVAVNLHDAQKLALANTVGQLSLALRNPLQTEQSSPREISLNDLRSGPPRKAAVAPKIRVYRSAKASDYNVEKSGK